MPNRVIRGNGAHEYNQPITDMIVSGGKNFTQRLLGAGNKTGLKIL